MPKYIVHADVMVPVRGFITVEADSEEEAIVKAMAADLSTLGKDQQLDGAEPDEWHSHIWQQGDWTSDIAWDEAEDFRVTYAELDPVPADEASFSISSAVTQAATAAEDLKPNTLVVLEPDPVAFVSAGTMRDEVRIPAQVPSNLRARVYESAGPDEDGKETFIARDLTEFLEAYEVHTDLVAAGWTPPTSPKYPNGIPFTKPYKKE